VLKVCSRSATKDVVKLQKKTPGIFMESISQRQGIFSPSGNNG